MIGKNDQINSFLGTSTITLNDADLQNGDKKDWCFHCDPKELSDIKQSFKQEVFSKATTPDNITLYRVSKNRGHFSHSYNVETF